MVTEALENNDHNVKQIYTLNIKGMELMVGGNTTFYREVVGTLTLSVKGGTSPIRFNLEDSLNNYC